jgi:molybdopterin-guanine dinucleotide biosynthesis protein B
MKIFGFAGWSGSGKTSLIERALPHLMARGLVVSLVKHAHHDFDVDQPGKDSHRHRQAGCREVLVASSRRWALMHELRGAAEPALDELTAHMSECDLLLVEGFKREAIPKIEVYRHDNGKPALHPNDPSIVAVATDRRFDMGLPQFALDDAHAVAAFICAHPGIVDAGASPQR